MKPRIPHFLFLLLLLAMISQLACTSDNALPVSSGASRVENDGGVPLGLAASKESLPSSGVPSVASEFPTSVSESKGIGVTGLASISVVPDLAVLDIGVESFASTVGLARLSAAKAMESVISSLNGEGVSSEDIQTQRFDIYPRYEYQEVMVSGRQTSKQVLSGYTVNNSVRVKIRELEKVGDIVDKAADSGGDFVRIHGITFAVEDSKSYAGELRTLAVEDALQKANHYASLVNLEIGSITSLTEVGAPAVQPYVESQYGMRAMSAPASTSLSGGEFELTLTIYGVFSTR